METTEVIKVQSGITGGFKIYLIVWKLWWNVGKDWWCNPFKIYLIVWKHNETNAGDDVPETL